MTAAAKWVQPSSMWPYHPDLLAKPVPRYTSFPTAADFTDLPGTAYCETLEGIEGDVSLYVHIPFCEKICFYCGCNTGAAGKRTRLEAYLDALACEIATVSALLPDGSKVGRVSFGGGSPNAIAPEAFLSLYECLSRHFGLSDPILSIELDPRSLTREWTEAMGQAGVQRASLGVQTFAPHCQSAIGRVQPEDQVVEAVDLLREAGVSSLNFDLMYGLPNQTRGDLLDSLHRTRVLGADRVALFGYAHVPHLVPRQRAIDGNALPGQDERFAMAGLGFSYLCTHGYTPVGFDHFARPGGDPLASAALRGTLRRNFQGFTDDDAAVVIGLGSSAISTFPGLLAQNEKNTGRYRMIATQGLLASDRGILRSADDIVLGRIIEELLCRQRAKVPSRILHRVGEGLTPFRERDLASLDADTLTILSDGLPYSRAIASLFDPYRLSSPRMFSSAV